MGHIGPPIAASLYGSSQPENCKDCQRYQRVWLALNIESTNELIEGFYGSSYAAQSLRYQPGSGYGPERVLALWMSNVVC